MTNFDPSPFCALPLLPAVSPDSSQTRPHLSSTCELPRASPPIDAGNGTLNFWPTTRFARRSTPALPGDLPARYSKEGRGNYHRMSRFFYIPGASATAGDANRFFELPDTLISARTQHQRTMFATRLETLLDRSLARDCGTLLENWTSKPKPLWSLRPE